MTQLHVDDIQTKEVLHWEGVHLFHFHGSSCSQKTRIFLNLKGIDWEPHSINLPKGENLTPWYLGINPRGLVPALVINGEVHIESNDIIQLLDARFPQNQLIPDQFKDRMSDLLHHEDALHMDLRSISFRYTQNRGKAPKSAADLENFRHRGSGTVQGKQDPNKAREIAYWETYAKNEGITDAMIKESAAKFRTSLNQLAQEKGSHSYLLGDTLTVLDIAWYIYVNRLVLCGYPLDRLHPELSDWFTDLNGRPEFTKEVVISAARQAAIDQNHQHQAENSETLIDVADFFG